MRINLSWLGEYCELPELEILCADLAASGVEVEGVFDPAKSLADVRVVELRALRPHPDAERLQICAVDGGTGSLAQVVCGASNLAVGQKVAWAAPGAQLGNLVLASKTIRGVASAGMLCSRAELGLSQEGAGLWVLPPEAGLGEPVARAAALSPVLILGITPNRPDLLAHLGVAREVSAAASRRLRPNTWRLIEKGPEVTSLARIIIDDAAACRRFSGRIVRGLRVGPSPSWLRERLESIGQRSVNNVVDVTNYVMFELGQPLHAYDLPRLAAEDGLPTLRVRRATAGELLRTLDGVERTLHADDLVVADGQRPVALAGLMGGSDTQVQVGCTQVLLEGAYFEPRQVRQMSRRHGLRTEASQRFERGVDAGMVARAVERCAQLLAEVAEGEVAKGDLEFTPKLEPPREIPVRLARVERLLGVAISAETAVQLLEPLDIRCLGRTEAALIFAPPTGRADLQREVDLIEELARRQGYARIPSRLPDASGPYVPQPRAQPLTPRVRQAWLAAGCSEVVTYGMGRPSEQAAPPGRAPEAPLLLQNPLGEELRALRTSLVPNMLRVVAHNRRHGSAHVRLFELGTTFHARVAAAEEDPRDAALPEERLRAACLMLGGRDQGRWYESGAQVDFADLAGAIEQLREVVAHGPLQLRPQALPGLSETCSAGIFAGDVCLGWAGMLEPAYQQAWDLSEPVYAAEIDLSQLQQQAPDVLRARPLVRAPSSRRDVALVVPRTVHSADVRAHLQAHAGGALGPSVVERVWLFDVYQGKPVPPSHVSLGFAVQYRHPTRTLTDVETSAAFTDAVAEACRAFDAQVRA